MNGDLARSLPSVSGRPWSHTSWASLSVRILALSHGQPIAHVPLFPHLAALFRSPHVITRPIWARPEKTTLASSQTAQSTAQASGPVRQPPVTQISDRNVAGKDLEQGVPAARAAKPESRPSDIASAVQAAVSRVGKADETTVATHKITKEITAETTETTSGGSIPPEMVNEETTAAKI